MTTASELAESILLRGRSTLAGVAGMESEGATKGLALSGRLVPLSIAEPFHWTSQVCRSASELLHTLQWSGGVAGGLGPIPLLRARRQFFESLRTTVFSVSLVVQAQRVVAALGCEDVACKPDLPLPVDNTGLDAFVAAYGDSWVQSVWIGGHMQGVYTLYAQSREQAKEVASAIDALVSTGPVSLGPSFSQQLKTIAKDANVNVRCQVSIAGLANPPAITEETMAAFASGFGAIALDQPEVLGLQTLGYEEVEPLRNLFAPVANNRRRLCGQGSTTGWLRQGQRLRELLNQCGWVEGTYAAYGLPPDPSLTPNREQLRADIRDIEALCAQFQSSPATPLPEPVLEGLATGSPRLQVRLSDGEVMGGRGGEPFRYQDRDNAVRRRRRLVQVGLRAGNRIDQIRLRYHQEPIGEADEWISACHGGEGGSDLGDMELPTGVGLTRIQAKTGIPNGRVDQLWLTSDDGQRIGGGGDKGNTPLDWQAEPNQVVLGFSGRCQAELDSLWAVIATFGPLAWEPVQINEDP
ncbi:MAG: hypothetical protein VKO39_07120 [Cyanobacteriota bacterium]|nr:hypothetical protein [Cyanobacteriota bacterium]